MRNYYYFNPEWVPRVNKFQQWIYEDVCGSYPVSNDNREVRVAS